jgi:hypothetical protein
LVKQALSAEPDSNVIALASSDGEAWNLCSVMG